MLRIIQVRFMNPINQPSQKPLTGILCNARQIDLINVKNNIVNCTGKVLPVRPQTLTRRLSNDVGTLYNAILLVCTGTHTPRSHPPARARSPYTCIYAQTH